MLQPIERRTCEAVGASRYYIIADLGSGGMARVELAVQSNLERVRRLAVIKRVHAHLAEQSEFVCMFIEEARIATAFNHPNVVQTYEAGHDVDGCFLAMEFLRGQPFHRLIRTVGEDKLDPAIAVEVLIATLQGLEYAHSLRDLRDRPMAIVHRDISPQNVFVTYDGQIKILDFGIAKSLGSSIQTHTGMLKGKVSYMAPEQVKNRFVDARADLYAVGVMLWEAIAGRRRWGNMSEVAILQELIELPEATSPNAVERKLPELADEICMRALAPNPRDRYRNAEEFRADLIRLAEQLGPRPSANQIGEYIKYVFDEERRQEQALIEAQLERLSPLELKGGARMFMDDLPASTRVFARPEPTPTPEVGKLQHTSDSSYGASVGDSTIIEAHRGRARSRWLAIAATAMLVAIGVAFSSHNRVRNSHATGASGLVPTVVPPTAPVQDPAEVAADPAPAPSTKQSAPPADSANPLDAAKTEGLAAPDSSARQAAPSRKTPRQTTVRRSGVKSSAPSGIDRSDPWND
jgi:serine/threonine-protein kinase